MNQDEIAVRLTEVDARSKSNTHRLDAMEGQIDAVNRLATSVEVLVTENKHQTEAIKEVKADVTSLNGKVEAIEQKPAKKKKWEYKHHHTCCKCRPYKKIIIDGEY